MNAKSLIWIGMTIGSTLGSLVPYLWGGGVTSASGILLAAVGGLFGIWCGYKLGHELY